MVSSLNIYVGAGGRASSRAGSILNEAIIDPKLAGNGGIDFGMWAAVASAALNVASKVKTMVTESKWYKTAREKWNKFRGKGGAAEMAAEGADDVAKGVANTADDVAKGATAVDEAAAVTRTAKAGVAAGDAAEVGGIGSRISRFFAPVGEALTPVGRALAPVGEALAPVGRVLAPVARGIGTAGTYAAPVLYSVENVQNFNDPSRIREFNNRLAGMSIPRRALEGLLNPMTTISGLSLATQEALGFDPTGEKARDAKAFDTQGENLGAYAQTSEALLRTKRGLTEDGGMESAGQAWAKAREKAVMGETTRSQVPGQAIEGDVAARYSSAISGGGELGGSAGAEQLAKATAPLRRGIGSGTKAFNSGRTVSR